ncbi:response regulator transcription factor [Pseudoflavitalea sp. G-6-1-2]|uniref:response regulator transcription factor n=1 Tax=Pseudoflavitalea sp. G-6-1-2 TaxID=2728841 RepID=UPI00146CE0A6|nr:DNA-binding response regulator [Pseudoflavitalea sp. G-6-1-2]NML21280.1 response regulator transcription factor [Pseudoflavitalea sp. G-6-1-2]
MIRVLIIEDEIIIARFIELQLRKAFQCNTRIAISVNEAREAMAEMQPHLVLCDINLCDEVSGIELVTEFKSNYVFELIYITSYQNRSIIEQASATNPANYIIKPVDEAQLFAGVQLVITKMEQTKAGERVSLAEQFNNTELMILQLIRDQKTTKEIAQELHLSPYTIKNHRHNICRKLDLEEGNNALLKWVMQHQQQLG